MADENLLPAVDIGDLVELNEGERGSIIEKSNNLGFPSYEILLASGKIVTEARYRFNLLQNYDTIPVINERRQTESESGDNVSTIHNSMDSDDHVLENVDIEAFIQGELNRNTQKKTQCDVNKLRNFMDKSLSDMREIEKIPPDQLCKVLCLFFMNLKTRDGSDYEPTTVRGICSSIDRYLKQKNYGFQIITSPEFSKVNDVIKTKQKKLKREGKGNLENRAEALTDNDIDKLFEKKQLGLENPESLLRTMWFLNTVHFGMRSVTEHRDMKWGDVRLCFDTDGREYIEMCERQTKTRPGTNPRNVRTVPPRAWANPDNPSRCPIVMYKFYSDRRPATYCSPEDPFYIATNTNVQKSTRWFKAQPVGVNKLGKFMSTMAKNAGLLGSADTANGRPNKRITNHSARKYMVQKLSDRGLPPNQIMQISGHKNIQSVNSYSSINTNQQRAISDILSSCAATTSTENTTPTSTCNMSNGRPPVPNSPVLSLSQTHLSRHKTTAVDLTGLNRQSTIFNGPIYGGTFNISINTVSKKRPRIIYSSDESD